MLALSTESLANIVGDLITYTITKNADDHISNTTLEDTDSPYFAHLELSKQVHVRWGQFSEHPVLRH